MKTPGSGQPLDRDDICIFRLEHRNETTIYQRAVHQDGARAALALAAAFLRTRQPQLVSQHVQQSFHRVHTHGQQPPIYPQGNFSFAAIVRRIDHRPPSTELDVHFFAASAAIASKMSSGSNGTELNGTPTAFSTPFTIAGAGPSIGN